MSERVKYLPVTQYHIDYIASRMRVDDINEVRRSSGHAPHESLQRSVDASSRCATIVVDDEVCGITGVVTPSIIGGAAIPWMLGTDHLVKDVSVFFRETKIVVADMMQRYPVMYNYVDVENRLSVRWLKAVGFKLHPAEPHGVSGHLFHKFTKGL